MGEMREAQPAPLRYFRFRAREKQGENVAAPGWGARHKNGARGFSSESRGKSLVLRTSIRAFPNVSTVSCGLRTVRGTGRYPDLLGFLDVAMPERFKTQVYVVHPPGCGRILTPLPDRPRRL